MLPVGPSGAGALRRDARIDAIRTPSAWDDRWFLERLQGN